MPESNAHSASTPPASGGRLNAQKDAVTNKTFAQCWSLDSTGNWRKFTEDSNGDGVWDLDQLRTANWGNEDPFRLKGRLPDREQKTRR